MVGFTGKLVVKTKPPAFWEVGGGDLSRLLSLSFQFDVGDDRAVVGCHAFVNDFECFQCCRFFMAVVYRDIVDAGRACPPGM